MYLPAVFAERRFDVLSAFIEAHPFATLIANTADGLLVDHVPMLIEGREGHCRLRGHVSRNNPVWMQVAEGSSVMALFSGAQRYVSPSLYPSKHDSGEVVPTWNYSVAHARGVIHWIQDLSWLRAMVSDLTSQQERTQAQPWQISDAPAAFIDRMLGAIVGFQIEVEWLVGKFKASQNRSARDRAGVRAGFIAAGLSDEALGEIVRGE